MDKPKKIIAACEKHSQQAVKKILDDFFKELDSRFLEFADKAKNNAQQWQLLEISRHLKTQREDMETTYLVELKEGFRLFVDGRFSKEKNSQVASELNLALMAEDKLEVELAQSSFSRRAETRFNEELYGIHQRLSMLVGGKKIGEEGNPIGPSQLAVCLEKTLPLLTEEIKFKTLVYRVFEKTMLRHLGDLYKEINQCLIDAGVLPNLRYMVSKQEQQEQPTKQAEVNEPESDSSSNISRSDTSPVVPSGAMTSTQRRSFSPQGFPAHVQDTPQHYVPTVPKQVAEQVQVPDAKQPSAQHQQDLYSAISTMQKGIVRPAGWRPNDAGAVEQKALVSVLDSVQVVAADGVAQFDDEQLAPCSTVSEAGVVSQQLQDRVSRKTGKNINESNANTIDLVGMIFEYMLGDDALPDNVKSVLSYLHTPYLKIAFLDEVLFAKPEHPARQLLNLLEDIGSKWVNDDGTSQFKALLKLKGVVRRILMEFHQDLSLIEELLLELKEFDEKVQRNVSLLEKRAAQKAEGEDKLKQVKKLVHYTVKSRTAGKKLPSPIVVLLLHPWSEYLAFVLLRFGQKSEQWNRGLAVMDDVLWSITPKSSVEDQKRLVVLQDSLQEELKQGFNSIAYDTAKANKLLDAIQGIHEIALQNRSTKSAPEKMREEIESTAVGHEEATAVVLVPETPEEKEIVDKLGMVEFGTWVEFDEIEGLRKQRLKIAWFNSKTLQYMLVNRAGKQAAVLSAVEIARHMLSKKARMINGTAKPFFERALENIFTRLHSTAA